MNSSKMYKFSFLMHHRITHAQRDLVVIAQDITEAAQKVWEDWNKDYIISDCRHCATISE